MLWMCGSWSAHRWSLGPYVVSHHCLWAHGHFFILKLAWYTSCNIWYSSAHIRRHASHHASYERLPENTNLISDIIEYFEWKFKLVLSPLVSLKITFITQHVNQFSLYSMDISAYILWSETQGRKTVIKYEGKWYKESITFRLHNQHMWTRVTFWNHVLFLIFQYESGKFTCLDLALLLVSNLI